MGDLLTRPYRAGDAPALTELLNLIEVAAGGEPAYLADDIDTYVATVTADPERDTRLVLAGDTLVAAGVVPTPPQGGYKLDLEGGVRPGWRGRGLGREMLGWQLARARELHTEHAPGSGWEVHASSMLGDEAAIRLYERMGLTPGRYWFEMVADLPVSTEPVGLPAGLDLVTYTPDRARALYEAHMEAFQDHWGYQRREWEKWAPLSVEAEFFIPDLSLLVLDGDDIAGYVLNYRDPDPKRMYIGQVGVRRPWRRRGIAAALLTEALARAAGAGFTVAVLGVDADSPTGAGGVYERVGFRYSHRAATYVLPIRS
jgi:mycothiol synthase